jgi:hypothetical protein
MKSSSVLSAAAAVLALTFTTACDGLKEAMTAHVDTVARAGSQELSVDQLATLLGQVQMPPRKDIALTLANTWIDYQLVGQVAASGDTTIDNKALDQALWMPIASLKARKYIDAVSKNWGVEDTAAARKMYDNGDLLAASHILVLTKGKPESDKAAAKARAEKLRAQVTSANFASMAQKNSDDKGSAVQGGSLGVFPKGMMVPEFEKALLALKPGEISPVIETQFGYHIIRRATYDEVKTQLLQNAKGRSRQVAESTFVANLQKSGEMQLKADAGANARTVLNDPDSHAKDGTVLATSKAGDFTAGRLAQWLAALPMQAVMQQRMQLQGAPDSIVANMLVKNFVTNELVLRAADSAKMGPTPQEIADLHKNFISARDNTWMQLGVDPHTLADSTKNGGKADREAYAARHLNDYLAAVAHGRAQYVEVPGPVARALRDENKVSLNQAGLDRAVERAAKVRATADSAKRASQPPSVIPMPGDTHAGPAGAANAPASATPNPSAKPDTPAKK